jgi:sugar O-acyltransferase (sialic acid O-acetyltransferase NeuD family)
MRVLIIGAGGHAQVVADILLRMADDGQAIIPVGFLDDKPALLGLSFLGLPVVGRVSDLPDMAYDALIVAVGENRTRKHILEHLSGNFCRFAVALHPRSILAPDVKVGNGSMVCAGAIANTGAVIGAHVILNTGCSVDHHNVIGDCVHIAPGVHLGGEVEVGEGTLIGIGATVMPRRRIGSWSVVGAGALVHEDVPDGVVVVGVPARIVRKA